MLKNIIKGWFYFLWKVERKIRAKLLIAILKAKNKKQFVKNLIGLILFFLKMSSN